METVLVGPAPARALLVHGNDLCAPFYRPLAEQLAARGLSTTLTTLPGFHREPPLPAPSWQAMVDLVIEALPPAPALLIGHSMGGLIALLAAARRPAALERLVLLEPAIFSSRWVARTAARRYLGRVVRGDREQFVNWNGAARRVHDPEAYPGWAIDLYLDSRRSGDRATSEALFSTLPSLYPLPCDRIEVPVLLVTGAEAGWRGRFLRRKLVRQLAPEQAVIPGAAHWLANEADAEVAQRIAEFVQ